MANEQEKINFFRQLYNQMLGSKAGQAALQAGPEGLASGFEAAGMEVPEMGSLASQYKDALTSKPLRLKAEGDLGKAGMRPLAENAKILLSNVKAHPIQAGGTLLNAAGNVAGLVNDDKLLGQVIGTAGGALLGNAMGFTPFGLVNSAMAGGNLGMLFDMLRSKKEKQNAQNQYVQQYT